MPSLTTQPSKYSHRDNFVVTIKFSDGSLATLTYTAMGSKKFPKERMEVFFDGKVAVIDDYKQLTVAGTMGNDISSKTVDKGHKHMLELFGDTIQNGGDWPIPFWQQIQATEIALEVEKKLMAQNKTKNPRP